MKQGENIQYVRLATTTSNAVAVANPGEGLISTSTKQQIQQQQQQTTQEQKKGVAMVRPQQQQQPNNSRVRPQGPMMALRHHGPNVARATSQLLLGQRVAASQTLVQRPQQQHGGAMRMPHMMAQRGQGNFKGNRMMAPTGPMVRRPGLVNTTASQVLVTHPPQRMPRYSQPGLVSAIYIHFTLKHFFFNFYIILFFYFLLFFEGLYLKKKKNLKLHNCEYNLLTILKVLAIPSCGTDIKFLILYIGKFQCKCISYSKLLI